MATELRVEYGRMARDGAVRRRDLLQPAESAEALGRMDGVVEAEGADMGGEQRRIVGRAL